MSVDPRPHSRVLVVEDEPTISAGLQDDLRVEGFDVDVVEDGVAAEQRALTGDYALIVLDIMLPKKDGLAVCRAVRAAGLRTPIILLTARGQESDKVLGLELGADDYVTKPFSPRELVARIRAVLRRAEPPGPAAENEVWTHGELSVDFARFLASRGGEPLALTPTEFKILRTFVGSGGRVLTVDDVLERVWGRDVFLTDRVVYTHMNNLRSKIEDDPANPRLIVSVRGVGYRFEG
jgi:two-component system alkaline phosphatase synthesis response regulator PhoP